jgi:hypothetical protein
LEQISMASIHISSADRLVAAGGLRDDFSVRYRTAPLLCGIAIH